MKCLFKLAVLSCLLLTACTKHAGSAVDEDPIESSSIPINGEGTDPLYARLLGLKSDLPALADLIQSGIVDSVLCNPQSCVGIGLASCSLVLGLPDAKRELCVRSLKSNAAGVAELAARPLATLFREATRPLVQLDGVGHPRRMTMMTRKGSAGFVVIDRALALAVTYHEFLQMILHELIGHKLPNPSVAAYTGDLSASPPFSGLEPGRDYADTVAAAATQIMVENLAAVPGSVDRTFNDSGSVVTNGVTLGNSIWQSACDAKGAISILSQGESPRYHAILARFSADGALDLGFGAQGKVAFEVPGATQTFGYGFSPDGDRTLLSGSWTTPTGSSEAFVARFTGNGTLDTTFGHPTFEAVPGIVTRTLLGGMGGSRWAYRAYPLANGKMLVAGASWSPYRSLVYRLNANYLLDNTYGLPGGAARNGYQFAPIGVPSVGNLYYDSAVAPDGSLFVLTFGYPTAAPSVSALWLLKYDVNGDLDADFGTDGPGMMRIPFDNNEVPAFTPTVKLLRLSDGQLLVTAFSSTTGLDSEPRHLLLARVLADGSGLDPTFGNGGRAPSPFAADAMLQNSALLLQTDGKILFGGSILVADYDFTLTRFTADGKVDRTFNGGVPVKKNVGSGADAINSLCLQPGGKIVAAGTVFNGSRQAAALVRFNNH